MTAGEYLIVSRDGPIVDSTAPLEEIRTWRRLDDFGYVGSVPCGLESRCDESQYRR